MGDVSDGNVLSAPSPLELDRWKGSIEPFGSWIDAQHVQAAKHWTDRLTSGDPTRQEGAVAEAAAWDWLSNRVDRIEIVPVSSAKTPDFRCTKEGHNFFVEVANVSRAAMTEVTGMPDTSSMQIRRFITSPWKRLHSEILGKVEQGLGLDAAYLPFVTTLHWRGSRQLTQRDDLERVLTSESFLSWTDDEPRNMLDFKHSAFTKTGSLLPMRSRISGALFGPFGLLPSEIRVHGILNPTATHPLDPRLLPDVPFGRFRRWPPPRSSERSLVEWTDEPAA